MDTAAEHARLANGAYIARALHNAITGRERPEFSLLRELIIEVAKLADQLRHIGVNLNQVLAVLHTTGHMPESLPAHAAAAAAAFHKVDELADTLSRGLATALIRLRGPAPAQVRNRPALTYRLSRQ